MTKNYTQTKINKSIKIKIIIKNKILNVKKTMKILKGKK